jgi:hypothetical protein
VAHDDDVDRQCPRCRALIMVHIPHECDPSICIKCGGVWKKGQPRCKNCAGTGKTQWRDPEHTQDCEVCFPK